MREGKGAVHDRSPAGETAPDPYPQTIELDAGDQINTNAATLDAFLTHLDAFTNITVHKHGPEELDIEFADRLFLPPELVEALAAHGYTLREACSTRAWFHA